MGLETRRRRLEFDPTLTLSVFWKQGVRAFFDHLDSSTNPYSDLQDPKRRLWFDGYYDARRMLKWGVATDSDEMEKRKAKYIRSAERGRGCGLHL